MSARRMFRALWAALLVAVVAAPADAYTVGTCNIEYFNISGRDRYTPGDCSILAQRIKDSGVDLLVLQEIEGDASMRFLTLKELPGWKFAGNDTSSSQDLYFLWNGATTTMEGLPEVYLANASFRFDDRTVRLFDRPLLVARFVDRATGFGYTAVAIHLKSQSTRGKDDIGSARSYNDAKRQAQLAALDRLVQAMTGPVFVMGDFNTDAPAVQSFGLLTLPPGRYSYDDTRSNLDHIGYRGLRFSAPPLLREVEMSLARRSTKRRQHPDHDMVLLDFAPAPVTNP